MATSLKSKESVSSTMQTAFQTLRKFTTTATPKFRPHSTIPSSCIKILPEVADALSNGQPVVALESTIVAHGMPYPQNLNLAKDVSKILREKGVVPATIAVKNGVFRVGLQPDEMENLALAGEEGRAMKCSTRDLPLVSVTGVRLSSEEKVQWGATTVAATMWLAHAAGISTFVTGGTGGVHRGGELSLDISADLIELSRTPVVVVSAGVKSILDMERTLEVLETYGVPTGTWKSDEFPAFFSPMSGVKSPARFDCALDVAAAYLACRNLGMSCGMLVSVPNHDPAGQNVEAAIQEVLEMSKAAEINGKDVTPFILRAVAEKTGGDSLRSNISLVKQNAEVGAEIANSISDLQCRGGSTTRIVRTPMRKTLPPHQSRVVCVGGAVIDTVAKASLFIAGTSNPGFIHCSDGGVGRNIAEVIGRLGSKPVFYTAIGKDDDGGGIISRLEDECGVVTTASSVHIDENLNTAKYLALLDDKCDLVGGVADMAALSKIPIPSVEELVGVELLVLDANATPEALLEAAKNGIVAGCRVCLDPTSVPKARLLSRSEEFLRSLHYIFPNKDELLTMAEESGGGLAFVGSDNIHSAASFLLSRMATESNIIITLGKSGVLLASKKSGEPPEFEHFPAESVPEIKSSNGAGDTLCGAFIHALLQGAKMDEAVRFGMKAAMLSLDCIEHAISPAVSSLKYT
ncbi:hypothetical protein ACHAWU_001498 [Discostella pseudostelligera]|uniref:Carbohydrate kinase PfkB domain-containing protein n=1 Tax=Discostella pseudostelligera TaxID=259834 RepID=A0ABD3MKJ4_9STRA